LSGVLTESRDVLKLGFHPHHQALKRSLKVPKRSSK